ncbi:MAG: NADH-quinone oxidoreductase subunit L [Chloroflexota bacterium]|nr:NADH-quinone oxidoreductase subunit L [Chloroflexota bacterium]MDQ5866032.1 NADH-quinone oxidoreductase subunit L [Chloroflexota bacterium]
MHFLQSLFTIAALAEETAEGAAHSLPEPFILNYIWIIPALPLLGFIINGLFGRRLGKTAGPIAVGLVGLSFLAAIVAFIDIALRHNADPHAAPFQYNLYTWIPSGDFRVDVSFLVDPLTAIMLMVVLSVGLLVHIYSLEYMADDPDFARFFAYLPLFVFSMLMLVMSNNFLLLFFGWEAVGLSSYLLIGFWYQKKSASDAAKKAFIVNRIGDFGFALGILLIFTNFFNHTPGLKYTDVFQAIEHDPMILGNATIISLLLFMGAMGKSAQFPLHVWLPDAMEGPTPVSALIHAATMVTAGIYMVARLNPIFSLSPEALLVVAIVGTVTAVLGATIAIANNDIKRVVAYSTVSQLGYMFAALGVGAWATAIFHLMTHAFFKGLLFLGSGSVIHGMHGEQDIRKMGQLAGKMKITYRTFLIGAAANAGVIPLAGFWSKDEIIGNAILRGNFVVGALLTAGSFLTAFYMFRLVFKVFHGADNVPKDVHPHESRPLMAVPLIILAIPAALIGFVGVPPDAGIFHHFIEPVFAPAMERGVHITPGFTGPTMMIMLISTLVALAGIFFAWLMYFRPSGISEALSRNVPWLYNALLNRWYFDEFYHRVVVDGGKGLAYFLWRFDQRVVDGAVNGMAGLTRWGSGRLKRLQTGFVQGYALAIGIGLIGLVTYLVLFLPK